MDTTYYSVGLAAAPHANVGSVWQDAQGLWHSRLHVMGYVGGPFGTRYDAELDVVHAWERVVYEGWI